MSSNSIPIILILLLLKQHSSVFSSSTSVLTALNTLQLESIIDNLHAMIHAYEKLSSLGQMDFLSSVPDMKKMLEAVEKIPL